MPARAPWPLTCLGGFPAGEKRTPDKTRASPFSTEVYGDPEVHPQPETYHGSVNPIGPRACYDEGKRISETLAYAYARQHGVDVRVARVFNTYGPRMAHDDGRVVSNFCVQALSGRPLTVYGDGTQTRSFQYVHPIGPPLPATSVTNALPLFLPRSLSHTYTHARTHARIYAPSADISTT